MPVARPARWPTVAVAMALVLAACGSAEQPPWGNEAEVFLEELTSAYQANDTYAVLDFYAPDAEVAVWRGDNQGGGLVSDLLRWNSGDLGQELEQIFLGRDHAVTLVGWPNAGELGAVVSSVENGLIVSETVFGLAAGLGRSLRASPQVLSAYEELHDRYAEAWSSGNAAGIAALYADDAVVRDELTGAEGAGPDAIAALVSSSRWTAVAAYDAETAPEGAELLYLGPAPYLRDPQQAVGVYLVEDGDGCGQRVAVHWVLEDQLIVREHRYHEIETFRDCEAEPPSGWWTGLGLPQPRDQVVTGTIRTAEQDITIHNGTARLEAAVAWGLEQFAMAGLSEPRIDSVVFEPTRGCAGVSGRVDDSGATRDLFLCIYESDLCLGDTECSVPALSRRVAILHELGHAWMLDNVDDPTRQRLLELTGREVWRERNVAWVDLGVEYSAEVMAWGLSDEAIPLVRLGSQPCEELMAAFELLTGSTPARADAGCDG